MSKKTQSDSPLWKETPLLIGGMLTLLVLGFFSYSLFCFPVVTPTESFFNKWSYLKSAPPNEIGDTLAGIAGALAFLWIIVTVMLQSKELAAQREELALTREEFKKMAAAQEQQVELLVQQGEIFADEQRQRREASEGELLRRRLERLINFFCGAPDISVAELNPVCFVWNNNILVELKRGRSTDLSNLNFLRDVSQEISSRLPWDYNSGKYGLAVRNGRRDDISEELSNMLKPIEESLPDLSKADRALVENLEFLGLFSKFPQFGLRGAPQ